MSLSSTFAPIAPLDGRKRLDPLRVTVVTSGHPSTCPRMVKAADALAAAGYKVRLVSVDYIPWAAATDTELAARRHWAWVRVPVDRATRPVRSRLISARQRAARVVAACVGAARTGDFLKTRAYARTHPELVRTIVSAPCDFIYGGTSGALAAVAEAAARTGTPYALDLEDLHIAESREPDAKLTHLLARSVLQRVLHGARFVTTSSQPMARAYEREFGVVPLVTHNVCDLAAVTAAPPIDLGPLELYWFSQTIGPTRGIEEIVRGAGLAGITASLHLRGVAREDFVRHLQQLASNVAPSLKIVVHPPVSPDALVGASSRHHIGFACERGEIENADVCVSNKLFTYMAAGLAIIASETEGQRRVASAIAPAVASYRPGDAAGIASALVRWDRDREGLRRARVASYAAHRERWHWGHPNESGVLLNAIHNGFA